MFNVFALFLEIPNHDILFNLKKCKKFLKTLNSDEDSNHIND